MSVLYTYLFVFIRFVPIFVCIFSPGLEYGFVSIICMYTYLCDIYIHFDSIKNNFCSADLYQHLSHRRHWLYLQAEHCFLSATCTPRSIFCCRKGLMCRIKLSMIIIMTIIMITNPYTNTNIRGDYEKKVSYQMKIFKIMINNVALLHIPKVMVNGIEWISPTYI